MLSYKPAEFITENDAEFDALEPVVKKTVQRNPRKKKTPISEFKGLRVKIVLARDPDYNPHETVQVNVPQDVYALMHDAGNEVQECMWVVILNNRRRVVGVCEIARGAMNTVAVEPIDIMRPVIAAGVKDFILVHNHPSGDTAPSEEDVNLTLKINRALKPVGMNMLDHIIIAGTDFKSMVDFAHAQLRAAER